jgi:hypothetical protein
MSARFPTRPARPRATTRGAPRRTGFTLIEAALTTAIIGFGVVSMMGLLATGTTNNKDSAQLTTGLQLARAVREMTVSLPFADPVNPTHFGKESGENLATFNDLDDFNGFVASPPVNARRQPMNEFDGWEQSVTVQTVDPDALTVNAPAGSQPAAKVRVVVKRNGRQVCRVEWFTFDATR